MIIINFCQCHALFEVYFRIFGVKFKSDIKGKY